MANIKSQIKRNKQNEKAHQRNKAVKSELRTHVRKFREAAEPGNVEAATTALQVATRKLDKAVSKGVIHKNQAANRKSAIAKKPRRAAGGLSPVAVADPSGRRSASRTTSAPWRCASAVAAWRYAWRRGGGMSAVAAGAWAVGGAALGGAARR